MQQSPEIATVGRRFNVVGMTCSHCEHAIETEVGAIAGVSPWSPRMPPPAP